MKVFKISVVVLLITTMVVGYYFIRNDDFGLPDNSTPPSDSFLPQYVIDEINASILYDILNQPKPHIDDMDIESIDTTQYHEHDITNLSLFIDYLESIGYTLGDIASTESLIENFEKHYLNALDKGIIKPIANDILIADKPNLVPMFQPFWTGGDTYLQYTGSTHQYISFRALEYIQPLFPNTFNFGHLQNNDLVRYSDFPDINGTESRNINNLHFYHGRNRDNYFRNIFDSGHNAKTRFIYHYENAVRLWNQGNQEDAFKSLGKSIHFITDLANPLHTGDQLPAELMPLLLIPGIGISVIMMNMTEMIANHVAFEALVQTNQEDMLSGFNASAPLYFQRLPDMAEIVTAFSFGFYSQVDRISRTEQNWFNVGTITLRYSVNAAASVMKRCEKN